MTVPPQRPLTNAVLTRLQTLQPDITVNDGEILTSPAIVPESGRIGPYVVLYVFGKAAGPDDALDALSDGMSYTIQVDCAAAYRQDCELVVDRVDALVNLWTPTVAGLQAGMFRPPVGYQPPPVTPDRTVQPPRYTTQLQYRLAATATVSIDN